MNWVKNTPAWPSLCRHCSGSASSASRAARRSPPIARPRHSHGAKNWSRCYSAARQPSASHKEAKALPTFLVLGALAGASIYYVSSPPAKATVLNDRTFVPYKITAREAISPTSFVFTISPQHPNPVLPYLAPESPLWRYPLWSVEFKQPQVQIARHYTPLPPLQHEDPTNGSLRFYVRAVGDGEMSNYLGRLGVGQDVWLRGPHTGFDLLGRLGSRKNIVFLAGGTGVVPGLQTAKAVLDRDEQTRVTVLWSIRKREELDATEPRSKPWWKFWSQATPEELTCPLLSPSPVGRQIEEMKAKYNNRLQVHVAVSQDRVRFSAGDVQKVLASSQDVQPDSASDGCQLHDQKLHQHASEFETPGSSCACSPPRRGLGKNLFVVCGPEGFISHYAGPKIWEGGRETQGPVGGVAAQLLRQSPQLANDWLVLKL